MNLKKKKYLIFNKTNIPSNFFPSCIRVFNNLFYKITMKQF